VGRHCPRAKNPPRLYRVRFVQPSCSSSCCCFSINLHTIPSSSQAHTQSNFRHGSLTKRACALFLNTHPSSFLLSRTDTRPHSAPLPHFLSHSAPQARASTLKLTARIYTSREKRTKKHGVKVLTTWSTCLVGTPTWLHVWFCVY
jgi:hypothetical protein